MKNLLLLVFIFISAEAAGQGRNISEVETILQRIKDEPNWVTIQQELLAKYGLQKCDSIVLTAKVEYYFRKKEYERYVKEYLQLVQKNNLLNTPSEKNSAAWRVFEYSSDPKDLLHAETWAREAQNEVPMNPYYLDTNANIFYKSGRIKSAIEWQMNAVWIGRLENVFITSLFRMKVGLPTWKYPEVSQAPLNNKTRDEVWAGIQEDLKRMVDDKVWEARLSESKNAKDWKSYTRDRIEYIEKVKPNADASKLNESAWEIFLYSNDKNELDKALVWSNKSLQTMPASYAFMDTYANLLYKSGKQKEAIQWSEKALALCPKINRPAYEATLLKIKKNEKTWNNE